MCAIISWSGKLPKGLLTQLLLKSERRGHDSTGVAFRLANSTVSYRQAVPAHEFVSDPENNKFLGDGRRALSGIAHTRRASPGMPIDNRNAHPFLYWRYFFAHNGKIQNWKELQQGLIEHYSKLSEQAPDEESKKTAVWCVNYCRNIQTDSKVLGPYIHINDFSPIVGCMALTWLKGENVFVTRAAKEACATSIIWRYIVPPKDEQVEDHMVTLVGSTHEIIDDSLKALEKVIEFDRGSFNDFAESIIYKVTPTGLEEHKRLAAKPTAVEDKFTSEEVKEEGTLTENIETNVDPGEPPSPMEATTVSTTTAPTPVETECGS